MVKSRMTGGRDAAANFRRAGTGLETAISAASRKALAPQVKEAKRLLKANGSKRTGELAKAMTVRKVKGGTGEVTHAVGANKKSPAARYLHLVELGTAAHAQPARGIEHPGASPHPFLRPSFDATTDQALEILGNEIGPAIEKNAAAKAKRAARRK